MRGTLLGGRYRLQDCIGSGGMGTVWRAQDERLGREVAVKTLTGPAPGDEAARQMATRFDREARYAARLTSPHIVTVHDYGEDAVDGRTVLYLVMERVAGRSLHEILRTDGPLPPDRAAALARQACAGLATAHADGVVHRDIKPSNIMVGPDDHVTLLDFGIARAGHHSGDTVTTTGRPIGTAPYMAPEQARGVRDLDGRTDLYSLGCVLYAMLTGRPPFPDGEWAEILLRHLTETPAPPSTHRPGLPHPWDDLLLALLAKEPADRPADAREVARRLSTLQSADAPTTPLGRARTTPRDRIRTLPLGRGRTAPAPRAARRPTASPHTAPDTDPWRRAPWRTWCRTVALPLLLVMDIVGSLLLDGVEDPPSALLFLFEVWLYSLLVLVPLSWEALRVDGGTRPGRGRSSWRPAVLYALFSTYHMLCPVIGLRYWDMIEPWCDVILAVLVLLLVNYVARRIRGGRPARLPTGTVRRLTHHLLVTATTFSLGYLLVTLFAWLGQTRTATDLARDLMPGVVPCALVLFAAGFGALINAQVPGTAAAGQPEQASARGN